MTKERNGARRRSREGWRAAACLAAVLATLLSAGAAHADGDPAAGKRVFARCQSCHQVGEKARNLVGPELNGVIGRTSGTVAGYAYSPALKDAAITWDHDTIAAFVAKPQAVAKGTRMPPVPPLKPADVDNLIAYLATFAADGGAAQ
ncbi:cytochrome c class I [Stappia sp. 22II-S9-Z10]|nr:cytochrome c class I [Stappia sp. 22II-S9-Z10]